MSEKLTVQDPTAAGPAQPLYTPIKRRSFFMYAGATAGATALLLSGCDDDDDGVTSNTIDVGALGANDVGVLNYAYALEQLEAAFYAQALTGNYFTSASAGEKQILTDIALHERIHADFFKTALGTNAIKQLVPDFSQIDFNLRARTGTTGKLGVLDAAKAFEDLGVQAYNGAGRFIQNSNNLTLAGKIVSVEARHAALIRDLLVYNSFAGDISRGFTPTTLGDDVLDPRTDSDTARQEKSKLPADVLAIANTFLAEGSKVSARSLVL